jgi:hypothetical protein
MPQTDCTEFQQGVDAAVAELKAIQAAGAQPLTAAAGPVQSTPLQGGDLASRFYETIGRLESAKRRYRAAVRSLSACLGSTWPS